MNDLEQMKKEGAAPGWLTEEGLKVLSSGYMLPGETPRSMYQRVSATAASYYDGSDEVQRWAGKFFDAMWKNWLCPASPVLSNMGTNRGLPISCNTIHVGDSVDSIFGKVHELAMLSKNGAGVGIYLGDVRGRGTPIKGNGKSEGVIPWAKVFDSTTVSVSQGSTRRGASAIYLPVEHPDIDEFIGIRKPTGDVHRQSQNIHHGVCIPDSWMYDLWRGDSAKKKVWGEILKTRVETGEPYLFFTDNVARQDPPWYKANGLSVKSSNICTEIFQHTDVDHTFVCCLSSLNASRFDEWKDSDLVETTVRFLDAVMQEYIEKSEGMPGLEPSRRSAIKGRALGIGVLGWHTLLLSKKLPFDSFESMQLNAKIFSTIRKKANDETRILAKEKGEPEWCKGFGVRNAHLMAVAPTLSNSTISGGMSQGIEPITANVYVHTSAQGSFIRKNPFLEEILKGIGKDDDQVWLEINKQKGSVASLDFLPKETKEVFLTAREINQYAIVKQAAQRQKWIDQGQSVNVFFVGNSDPSYVNGVHLAAWEWGLKSLYYYKAESSIRSDLASRGKDECAACEA